MPSRAYGSSSFLLPIQVATASVRYICELGTRRFVVGTCTNRIRRRLSFHVSDAVKSIQKLSFIGFRTQSTPIQLVNDPRKKKTP